MVTTPAIFLERRRSHPFIAPSEPGEWLCLLPLLHLDRLLSRGLRNKDVLPHQAALLDHLNRVFQATQFSSGIVRSKGELGSSGFGHFDKRGIRDFVSVV